MWFNDGGSWHGGHEPAKGHDTCYLHSSLEVLEPRETHSLSVPTESIDRATDLLCSKSVMWDLELHEAEPAMVVEIIHKRLMDGAPYIIYVDKT